MMIRDEDGNIYKTGLKLDYVPKQINIFNDEFRKEDVVEMACGRKHYVVRNKDNKMMVWGTVFKEKPHLEQDGFGLYFGSSLFDQGEIKALSMKYSIFGALVEHK